MPGSGRYEIATSLLLIEKEANLLMRRAFEMGNDKVGKMTMGRKLMTDQLHSGPQ
jgi:hypothetical protein